MNMNLPYRSNIEQRVTINTNLGMGGEQIGQSSSSGTNIAGDFEME